MLDQQVFINSKYNLLQQSKFRSGLPKWTKKDISKLQNKLILKLDKLWKKATLRIKTMKKRRRFNKKVNQVLSKNLIIQQIKNQSKSLVQTQKWEILHYQLRSTMATFFTAKLKTEKLPPATFLSEILFQVLKNGEQMVESSTSRNKKAKIGTNITSQILVPNFFDIKNKDQIQIQGNCYVVDTPGYGDTKGILTILANGYFHYRLYSKVKNMKFLLCFDANQLKNTGQNFVNTIIQWSASFKNYLKVRKDIWKSCIFIINKVEGSQNKQDIVAKLKNILDAIETQQEPEVEDALRQFIGYMVQEDRIYCIKKVKTGVTFVGNGVLKEIEQKITHWWSRKFNQETKLVDMKPVQFGLGKSILVQITKNNKSKKRFMELIQYYNLRAKQLVQQVNLQVAQQAKLQAHKQIDDQSKVQLNSYLLKKYSLKLVINQLVKDSMGLPDAHSFLIPMESYRQAYYGKYNPAFKEERDKHERQMFASNKNDSTLDCKIFKTRIKDKNYLAKKFQCLKRIEQLKRQINDLPKDINTFDWLQSAQKNIIQIIRELSRISFKRNKAPEIIYKYGYLIHRIVEQAKVFLLLTELCDKNISKDIKQQTGAHSIDIKLLLNDFMGLQFNYDNNQFVYNDLHSLFIQNFSLDDDKYKDLVVNETLIDFFTEIQITNDKDSQKLIKLILKYSDQFIQECEERSDFATRPETAKLIQQLMKARIQCQQSFHSKQEQQKSQAMFLIRDLTHNLARLLQLLKQHYTSAKVYDSVKFVSCVCRLYEVEIEGLKKLINSKDDIKKKSTNRQKLLELQINYSKYLAEHFRENKAIDILQEAFQIVKNNKQITTIKDRLYDLRQQIKSSNLNQSNKYERSLYNDDYFDEFEKQLQDDITQIALNLAKK